MDDCYIARITKDTIARGTPVTRWGLIEYVHIARHIPFAEAAVYVDRLINRYGLELNEEKTQLAKNSSRSCRHTAKALGVSKSTVQRWRQEKHD